LINNSPELKKQYFRKPDADLRKATMSRSMKSSGRDDGEFAKPHDGRRRHSEYITSKTSNFISFRT